MDLTNAEAQAFEEPRPVEPPPEVKDSEGGLSTDILTRPDISDWQGEPAAENAEIGLIAAEDVFTGVSEDFPWTRPPALERENDGDVQFCSPPRLVPVFPSDEETPRTAGSVAARDTREISFREDLRWLFPMLKEDTSGIVTWTNAAVLGAGLGGALAIRASHTDGRIRDDTLQHPLRWGTASHALRNLGEPSVQAPVIGALYGLSLWKQDADLHNFMKATISAYSITSLTTVAIKGIADTSRPSESFQGGHYGFPSFHTASAFSISATIEQYYGWQYGLPAYALSGLVGWSRIDQREHDLSDVVFGAVLGYVIGKSVAATHLDRDARFKVAPYYDTANQASGVMVEAPF